MPNRVRWLLLGVVLAIGCASTGQEPVPAALVGTWVNDRAEPDRSGWRQVLTVLDGLAAPEPFELALHADGTFSAVYGAEDFRTFQRVVQRTDLENPLSGTFRVAKDWSGMTWIELDPGAPERRVTLSKGRLTLHQTGQVWRSETYSKLPSTTSD